VSDQALGTVPKHTEAIILPQKSQKPIVLGRLLIDWLVDWLDGWWVGFLVSWLVGIMCEVL